MNKAEEIAIRMGLNAVDFLLSNEAELIHSMDITTDPDLLSCYDQLLKCNTKRIDIILSEILLNLLLDTSIYLIID